MRYADDKALAEYVGHEAGIGRITVRVLEAKGKGDGYYGQDQPFVHVRCEVWSDGGDTTTTPDHWQIDWYHGADIIRENFWEYIDEHCPYPDSVRAVIANLYLPEELSGLFALDPRKLEEEGSYKLRTIF